MGLLEITELLGATQGREIDCSAFRFQLKTVDIWCKINNYIQ